MAHLCSLDIERHIPSDIHIVGILIEGNDKKRCERERRREKEGKREGERERERERERMYCSPFGEGGEVAVLPELRHFHVDHILSGWRI